jgi:hypothetical protein
MSSRKRIREVLDRAEQQLSDAWSILATFRSAKPSPRIIEFQSILLTVLVDLEEARNDIGKERKTYIARKTSYNAAWFTRRMSQLAQYEDMLTGASGIARALGDAFAWFFYQFDRGLLAEHAKCQVSNIPPLTLGGRGERAFLHSVKHMEGRLVLHHGITTILRLGDFSLIDLKTLRVAGIGELKTVGVDGNALQIEARVLTTNERLNLQTRAASSDSSAKRYALPPSFRDRLGRQIRRMEGALKEADKTRARMSRVGELPSGGIDELNKLLARARCGRFTAARVTEGLVVLVYKQRRGALRHRLSPRQRVPTERLDDTVARAFFDTLVRDSEHNAGIFGSLLYDERSRPVLHLGTIPLFWWWDVDLQQIRKLLFQETIVITLFNPAPLLARLEAAGLQVRKRRPPYDFSLEHREGSTALTLENFEYFARLIAYSLFTEAEVEALVRDMIAEARRLGLEPGTRVNLQFSHMLAGTEKFARQSPRSA